MTEYASDWRGYGACLSADPELFFPISGRGPGVRQVAGALRVCARCTVRQQCLDFALRMNEPEGIWGGTTPEERLRVRRRNLRRAPGQSLDVPDRRAS
jgi:WhiB family redox-sensing transcriptional regulator